MSVLNGPISPDALETRARALLEPMAFDYIAGGAEDELTLASNRKAFDRWRFRHRVLCGVDNPDLSLDLLGARLSLPVLLGPVAAQRLAHPDGELASAAAAARVRTVFCLSTLSSRTIEEVAAVPEAGPRWFQLYAQNDRAATASLVDRAHAAGYQAIVFTVDLPVVGRRERDERGGLALPSGIAYVNLTAGRIDPAAAPAASEVERYAAGNIKASLGWGDLDWLISHASIPVLIKGLVRGDDALRAVQAGVNGVIVSNHGGRQLDRGVAALDALSEVVDAVAGTVPVLLDSGIRRGTDVLMALCLGASGVLVGRPYMWALAVGGQEGVLELLEQLRAEIATSMVLLGASRLAELNHDLITRAVLG